ncbi:hypothetical protein EVAR_90785_1 [Eumeta japonica]|uniref:Uncharacterized protein n=1 Tax=Eumeta variegata TaxID=151549 RepID=A0A4C1YJS9_EUMVA|nr:hypothetical protein EVAR_90785_1 [Eumeta japonica]
MAMREPLPNTRKDDSIKGRGASPARTAPARAGSSPLTLGSPHPAMGKFTYATSLPPPVVKVRLRTSFVPGCIVRMRFHRSRSSGGAS